MPAKISTARLIVAAILAIFVYGVIAAMLGTILPSLSETFNLTPEQNGNIALAQALGLIIASVSAGPLIDNKGKKAGLLLGLGLVAIALFGLSNAGGYGSILAALFLLGFGGGIIVTAGNALAADVNEERRASMLNLLNLFFGLGGLVTPLAASMIGGDAVRLAYTAAILAAATFIFHATTPMPAPSGERGFKASEVGEIAGRGALWLLALFLFLYVACEVGMWNWLARHLTAQGIPEASALRILSLGFALGMLIGRVVVSRILIKVSAPTVTLVSAILMAVTTFWVLQTTDVTVAWVAVFLAGVAMAPVFPTTLAMVGDAFPKATATAMGFVITCGWIGLAVSSRIIGSIAGEDPKRLQTALLLLPAFSVAMIVVNLALRPLLGKRKAQSAAA
ncbi:MAG TPA: MFS transporter [Bryobacteraceae bacterium]|nr:MFS transporter [Bryobacteraceae bacterium]HPU70422.1 MFS transporter [Bryobacteraceae bacterium]